MLTETGLFTKQRWLFQPASWRILREASCVSYARKVVPKTVAGIRIAFPETRVRLGAQVAVTTRLMTGGSLFALLYQPAARELAVQMGLIALDALQSASISGRPFRLFSWLFRPMKVLIARREARRMPGLMSAHEREEMHALMGRYVRASRVHPVLVHGDLHASHVIVNPSEPSLAFIDLEAMHIGSPSTDFAYLWIGYHYADPEMGRTLYRAYRSRFPGLVTERFDSEVRAELALRSQTHVCDGRRTDNRELEMRARAVLAGVLTGSSFDELCLGEKLH